MILDIVIPLLIFLSRIADVTLGTLRIILVSKSYKTYAAVIGFFEVLIWILAISHIIENLDSGVTYFAYALGFAVGTYVGMIVEEKIAIGKLLLQLFTKKDTKALVKDLHKKGFLTTSTKATSTDGNINMLHIIITRKNYKLASDLICKHIPNALFTVEDISLVHREIHHQLKHVDGNIHIHHHKHTKKKA